MTSAAMATAPGLNTSPFVSDRRATTIRRAPAEHFVGYVYLAESVSVAPDHVAADILARAEDHEISTMVREHVSALWSENWSDDDD